MNRTYDQSRPIYSESGIYEGMFTDVSATTQRDGFLRFLFLLISFFASVKVRRIAKAASLAGCLFGMIAMIGAMESGALPLLPGVLLAALLLGVEFLCLRGRKQ